MNKQTVGIKHSSPPSLDPFNTAPGIVITTCFLRSKDEAVMAQIGFFCYLYLLPIVLLTMVCSVCVLACLSNNCLRSAQPQNCLT